LIAAALIDYRQKDYGGNVKRAHIVLAATILALGILSLVPAIHASEAAEVDASEAINQAFAPDASVSLRSHWQSSENFSSGAVTQSPTGSNPRNQILKMPAQCETHCGSFAGCATT
jgi:hypothetical protein